MDALNILLGLTCLSGLGFAICILYLIIEGLRNIYVDGVEWS